MNASLICQVEDEYIPVIWFEYYNSSLPVLVNGDGNFSYSFRQNGQNLVIHNMFVDSFLMTQFECHILSSPNSDGSIPIANFTTFAIPGIHKRGLV